MKKALSLLLVLVLCLALSACSNSTDTTMENQTSDTRIDNDSPSEEPTTEPTEAPTQTPTEAPTEEPTEAPTQTPTEAPTEEPTEAPTASQESYINFDKMQFTVNGKTYTLGETTLQTMINDGVPFEEDDLANAGNNLNKNSMSSQGFVFRLTEHWIAQVYVLNDTDENKPMSECYIYQIFMPGKPAHYDEEQHVLSFPFPLELTVEDLKANAGEPTESDHWTSDMSDTYYDTLEYIQESTRYFNDREYRFEFKNGVLDDVYITYFP